MLFARLVVLLHQGVVLVHPVLVVLELLPQRLQLLLWNGAAP